MFGTLDRLASDVHLTKMRFVLLIRCLPKTPPSSPTSTGSHTATWRLSLTWTTSRLQLRSSTTVDEEDVRLRAFPLWTRFSATSFRTDDTVIHICL